jgi:hypothetical protein
MRLVDENEDTENRHKGENSQRLNHYYLGDTCFDHDCAPKHDLASTQRSRSAGR